MHVTVYGVLSHTPLWVFPLFAYLLFQGVRRLKGGIRELAKIWITPAIFIVWGLYGLYQRPGSGSHVLLWWLIGALPGFFLGFAVPISLKADRARRLVLLPGSVLPLVRIVIIFGGHYALRVLAAVRPAESAQFLDWDIVVSGASTGYFLGWALRLWRSYLKAPQVDLGPAAPAPA